MPSYVSPGVYIIEKDLSQYSPSINSSVVGIVGFASKGPVNKATLITSPQQLVDTFGAPNEGIVGQGLEGAIEILETTNSIYYVRSVTDASSLQASAEVQLGLCPAVAISSVYFGGALDSALGVSSAAVGGNNGGTAYFKIQSWDNNGKQLAAVEQKFVMTSGTTAGLSDSEKNVSGELFAFKNVFGGDVDGAIVGAYFDTNQPRAPYLVAPFAGSGAYMTVKAYTDSSYSVGFEILAAVNPSGSTSGGATLPDPGLWASGVRSYGSTMCTTADAAHLGAGLRQGGGVLFQSLYPGGGYNLGSKTDGTTSGNSIEIGTMGSPFTVLQVNEDGAAEETYKTGFVASGGLDYNTVFNQNDTQTPLLSNIVLENAVSGNTGNTITPTKISNFADSLPALGWTILGSYGGNASSFGGVALAGDGKSATVSSGEFTANSVGSRFVKAVQGTYGLTAGTNGDSTVTAEQDDAIIGETAADGTKKGMQALDDDVLNISMGVVPGLTNQNIQNALVTLAEKTQNFVALVAPPYAIGGTQDAINWGNGQSPYRTAAINSSYAASFWPWVKVFSQFDAKDIWLDPAIYGARQMAFTDSVSEPWFAPAGFRRGRLTKPTSVEVILNQGDRDSMYSGGNTINPVVNFPQQGITLWGQRTMQKNPSALDRINVRRLMIYLRKVILASTRTFVFEPNDPFTWDAIIGITSPLLADIQQRRGILEYKVVCDETTNTPVRVDRNELWCKVIIKPTKTAEILIFEINLTSQGAALTSA